MLDFTALAAKGAYIPNVVKKLYNDITPGDNLEAILAKNGSTADNCKGALKMLTDVDKCVRTTGRVPPPPGGYKALRLVAHVFQPGTTVSSIGYTLSHNKRKIAVIVVGVAVGALTGGLGIVVLAASTLGGYAADQAWRRWGHVILSRKGNMNFDPNSAEDYADIEKHITTWQDRIVKRQLPGILTQLHFQQQCRNRVNPDLLTSTPVRYSSCAEWIAAIEAVCRLRKITEEVHVGVKDIVHFWGLMTYEMIDRNEKFAARLSTILTAMNTQITKGTHSCTYGTSWFGDSSTSRRLSGGICYCWYPSGAAFSGGPIYPKHAINSEVMWEVRLRTEPDSLFMKLMQDASTWGGLIESAFTGGNLTMSGRFATRMARSVDMFSGGKPDRGQDISDLYPTIFTKTGEKWILAGAAPAARPAPTTLAVPHLGESGEDIALSGVTTTATSVATGGLGKVVGGLSSSATAAISGSGVSNVASNLTAAFDPTSAVASHTNIFSSVAGSAGGMVNVSAGYATAGLGIILEIVNFAENSALVNKGNDLLGNMATVSELITAHANVLKNHFGAIADAWKGFRKADDALMAIGACNTCLDAFNAAANLLRREMYYREMARLYQTLWIFVCLVASTHGGVIQELEDGNPELIAKVKDWLANGHTSTASGAAMEDVCQGYCYRPLTQALAVLYKIDSPAAYIGTPIRPIGQTATPRTA